MPYMFIIFSLFLSNCVNQLLVPLFRHQLSLLPSLRRYCPNKNQSMSNETICILPSLQALQVTPSLCKHRLQRPMKNIKIINDIHVTIFGSIFMFNIVYSNRIFFSSSWVSSQSGRYHESLTHIITRHGPLVKNELSMRTWSIMIPIITQTQNQSISHAIQDAADESGSGNKRAPYTTLFIYFS